MPSPCLLQTRCQTRGYQNRVSGEVGEIDNASIGSVFRSATGFHNMDITWYTISKIFYCSNIKEVQPYDSQDCY